MNSKNKYMILGIVAFFIVVGIVTFGISFAFGGDKDPLRNQKVDGLSFENAKIEYNNDSSTFTVAVYNETDDIYAVEEVKINVKGKDGETITLIGNVGGSLESDEGRIITASTNKDITSVKSLEYVVEK